MQLKQWLIHILVSSLEAIFFENGMSSPGGRIYTDSKTFIWLCVPIERIHGSIIQGQESGGFLGAVIPVTH